jgi:hypothetical protein
MAGQTATPTPPPSYSAYSPPTYSTYSAYSLPPTPRLLNVLPCLAGIQLRCLCCSRR